MVREFRCFLVVSVIGVVIAFNVVDCFGFKNADGGDLAEKIPLSELAKNEKFRPAPADVVVVDSQGLIHKSMSALSTNVVGVVSTNPAHVLRNMIPDSVPVALGGVVPCRVSSENGFIYPGDLLVSSSKPGYAMKAPKDVKPGTVIGKSLDKQDEEEGIVLIIVMLC